MSHRLSQHKQQSSQDNCDEQINKQKVSIQEDEGTSMVESHSFKSSRSEVGTCVSTIMNRDFCLVIFLILSTLVIQCLSSQDTPTQDSRSLFRVKRKGGGRSSGGGYVFIPDSSSSSDKKEIDPKGIILGIKSIVLKAILLTSLMGSVSGSQFPIGGGTSIGK